MVREHAKSASTRLRFADTRDIVFYGRDRGVDGGVEHDYGRSLSPDLLGGKGESESEKPPGSVAGWLLR